MTSGVYSHIFQLITSVLNVTVSATRSVDGTYGKIQSDGSVTGKLFFGLFYNNSHQSFLIHYRHGGHATPERD